MKKKLNKGFKRKKGTKTETKIKNGRKVDKVRLKARVSKQRGRFLATKPGDSRTNKGY